MRLYYINLDREQDRRAHMEQALAGLDFERVAATDGRQSPPTEKGPTRFEIACLTSHREAWAKFLTTDSAFACFLEDDVHFSPDFGAFVGEESWIPATAQAVKLDTFFQSVMLGPPEAQVKRRRLARLYTRHESCAAYILSREGAGFFMRATEKPTLPVDYIVFPEDPAQQGLMLLQLAPAVAIQDSLYLRHHDQGRNFASAIGKLDVAKPSEKQRKILFTLRREAERLYRQIFKARRYLVNRLGRGLRPEIVPFV
ncbi:glycosyltransferase family 25 protein [uncultured Rhodoblastus sp.]|uniref:glycosyltransferase family 25 protein n=1 Tax=uncultured Rhodoblastus sp. TaxID=543037 RepID=UPI0025E2424B|nr:glycosyltransferase family 25 protein [uncultured Rhodoblastus sp.]